MLLVSLFWLLSLAIADTTQANWVKVLRKEYPTCAFKANVQNSFGKGSLIQLLKQFSILHKERKQISVGLVGYPNVGKSSIINTLRGKQVCPTAPIPGETKVWRYVTLIKRIYLIDAPGIVPPNQHDTQEDILLRGVVRVENVSNPEQYIPAVLKKCKQHHLERSYELKGWQDHIQFLELLARKGGRLLKAGEPDLDSVAKMVLNDFMRGKIPWFTPAPAVEEDGAGPANGRTDQPGEVSKKRKREGHPGGSADVLPSSEQADSGPSDEEHNFEGFDSENQPARPEKKTSRPGKEANTAEDMIPLDVSSDEGAGTDDSEAETSSDDEQELSELSEGLSGDNLSESDEEESDTASKPPPNRKRQRVAR